jgi:hypothetical protein
VLVFNLEDAPSLEGSGRRQAGATYTTLSDVIADAHPKKAPLAHTARSFAG